MTGCGHNFHQECIVAWLSIKRQCPNCKNENISNFQIYCSMCRKKWISSRNISRVKYQFRCCNNDLWQFDFKYNYWNFWLLRIVCVEISGKLWFHWTNNYIVNECRGIKKNIRERRVNSKEGYLGKSVFALIFAVRRRTIQNL